MPNPRLFVVSVLVTLACAPAEESRVPSADAPLTLVSDSTVPEQLLVYVSDSVRAGVRARVLGSWGSAPRRFLSAGWHLTPAGHRENRLAVLHVEADSVVRTALDGGLDDAHWFAAHIYVGAGKVLVLGNVGSEYTWATRTLAIDSLGNVTDLGLPEMALPDTATMFSMGPGANALPHIRPVVRDGRFVLLVDRDLVADPGGRGQAMLCRVDRGRPAVWIHGDSGWTAENVERRPVSGDGPALACH